MNAIGQRRVKRCLVGGICGSSIRSNGGRKLGSRSPRTRCGIARLQLLLFVALEPGYGTAYYNYHQGKHFRGGNVNLA
jgi:hypothetical protein